LSQRPEIPLNKDYEDHEEAEDILQELRKRGWVVRCIGKGKESKEGAGR
jgi:hypothetical protein